MAITTLDTLIGAPKINIPWYKTGTQTLVGGIPYTLVAVAGSPSSVAIASTNAANGALVTSSWVGYPSILPSTGILYLSKVMYGGSVAATFTLYDKLFTAGTYQNTTAVALSSQPTWSTRMPTTHYAELELWVECAVASTGAENFSVTYTDGAGTVLTSTWVSGLTFAVGRCARFPLKSNYGIQILSSVTVYRSASSNTTDLGQFNFTILRPLYTGRVRTANDGGTDDFLKTGLPQIYQESALHVVYYADGTAVGLPYYFLEVASG